MDYNAPASQLGHHVASAYQDAVSRFACSVHGHLLWSSSDTIAPDGGMFPPTITQICSTRERVVADSEASFWPSRVTKTCLYLNTMHYFPLTQCPQR